MIIVNLQNENEFNRVDCELLFYLDSARIDCIGVGKELPSLVHVLLRRAQLMAGFHLAVSHY